MSPAIKYVFVSEPVLVCWETRIVFLSLHDTTRSLNNQEQEEWTIFRGPTVGSEYRTCSLFQRCPLCWYRANKHSISVLQWYLNNKHLKIIIKVWYSDHLYSDAQFLLLTGQVYCEQRVSYSGPHSNKSKIVPIHITDHSASIQNQTSPVFRSPLYLWSSLSLHFPNMTSD